MRDLGNVVREADSASLPEVTHELLRQLEACCNSCIRLSADPSALCARIGLPESLYAQLMLMNQPMRVDRLREQILDNEENTHNHQEAEAFGEMLVHDAEALAAFTGLTVDEVAAFAEQPYEEALRCAFEKRREAQQRFMVTWAPITADVSMWHSPRTSGDEFLARCSSVHAEALVAARRSCEREIAWSQMRGEY